MRKILESVLARGPRPGDDGGRRPPCWRATVRWGGSLAGLCLGLAAAAPASAASTYYVDCSAASNGTGSQASPFNSIGAVNALGAFAPGTQILFKRGSTCNGNLAPTGSGTAAAPNVIGAYGGNPAAPQPKINGGNGIAGILIKNVSYWTVRDLEVYGGYFRNVYVTADQAGTFTGFNLLNLHVHDNTWVPPDANTWYTGVGGVSVVPCGAQSVIDKILIDGISAHNTHAVGIHVGYLSMAPAPDCSLGGETQPLNGITNLTIQNSRSWLNDAAGSEVFFAKNVNILGNTLWNNGNGSNSRYNGEGVWIDGCENTRIAYNEAYGNYTGNNDGSGIDVDGQNLDTVVEFNYLHDNDAAGVSVVAFAGWGYGPLTSNTIVRYNVFANNARFKPVGELWLTTWNGGLIDGVQAYNNTFASVGTVALLDDADWSGTRPRTFHNNVIVSNETPAMLWSGGTLAVNNNTYFSKSGAPTFSWNGTNYASLAAFQSATGQDGASVAADALLNVADYHGNGMPESQFTLRPGSPAATPGQLIGGNGGRDFYGNPVSTTAPSARGAYNGPARSASAAQSANLVQDGGFESGSLAGWTPWNGPSLVGTAFPTAGDLYGRNGNWGGQLDNTGGASLEKLVTGLATGTRYLLTGWARNSASGGQVCLGAKGFGGTETYHCSGETSSFQPLQASFVTGPASSAATVYCWKPASAGAGYCDDLRVARDLASNTGFENGTTSGWYVYGTGIVTSTAAAVDGAYALQLVGSAGAEQTVTGLSPNTSYSWVAWVKTEDPAKPVCIGAKGFGGTEKTVCTTSTAWVPLVAQFTTGASNSSATAYIWNKGLGTVWSDSAGLVGGIVQSAN